ncbi:MAG TPA: hypothetical protein TECP_00011 [Hyphomicrobiaceae bacterium MAG_BT-2024]
MLQIMELLILKAYQSAFSMVRIQLLKDGDRHGPVDFTIKKHQLLEF